jgi:hypothetical protein
MQDQPAAARHVELSPESGRALSAQQLFERERVRQSGAVGRSLRNVGRALVALGGHATSSRPAALPAVAGSLHLAGLVEHGAVSLHSRRTRSGRRWIDHLIVAPSGVYVVEDRTWSGQVAVSDEWLYVDGRARSGVPEAVRRTAEAVQLELAEELPLGLGVTPVLCLPAANATWRPLSVHGVAVFTARGLPRHVRQAEPLLGRDTIVRLALAADRLLEHAPPAQTS